MEKGNFSIFITYVENVDEEYFQEYIKYEVNLMNSIYEPIPSPYPGRVSNQLICPDDLKSMRVFS